MDEGGEKAPEMSVEQVENAVRSALFYDLRATYGQDFTVTDYFTVCKGIDSEGRAVLVTAESSDSMTSDKLGWLHWALLNVEVRARNQFGGGS